MGWFFKDKPKAEAVAMSGVISCDGKHHHFTQWRDIILEKSFYAHAMGKVVAIKLNAQERHCIICNYRERREMD